MSLRIMLLVIVPAAPMRNVYPSGFATFGADRRARARVVLDEDRVVEAPGHALGRGVRDEVVRAAGRERHDPLERMVGPIGSRAQRERDQAGRGEGGEQAGAIRHGSSGGVSSHYKRG
jgi:hypothetical protein